MSGSASRSWEHDRDTPRTERIRTRGADVAHRSMLVYYPEINAGITTPEQPRAVQQQRDLELAEAFFGDEMELGEEGDGDEEGAEFDAEGYDPEEWAPTEDELADYAGRFYSEEIETFYTFAVEEGELVMRQRRLGEVTLSPGEEDNFTGGNLTFVFERDRNGVVIGLYLSNVRTRDVRFGRVG